MNEEFKDFIFNYIAVLNNIVLESEGEKQKFAIESYIRFYNALPKEIKERIGLPRTVPFKIDKDLVRSMYDNYIDENEYHTKKSRMESIKSWFKKNKEII